MLNKVMLIGNAGRDPEIRHLENGTAVVTLPIATTERYKDRSGEVKEQTEWHTVVFWRNLAEIVDKHVRKGSQLYIEGRLRTRSWEDQHGQKRFMTEIVAETMRFLGRRPESQDARNTPPPAAADVIVDADDGDDLPF